MSSTDALQAALAGEHAAVYVLGVLGARSRGAGLTARLRSVYDAHVAAREALTARIRAQGEAPVGPAAAYAVPTGLATDDDLRAAALEVERRCAALYLDQVAAATGEDRRLLAASLTACALRELGLGGDPQDLPGTRTADSK